MGEEWKKSVFGVKDLGKGVMYEGEMQDDKPNGHGVCRWENGRLYEGQFEGGRMHGRGRLHASDGRTYEGTFVANKPHGWGVLSNGQNCYQGEFAHGRRHGPGTLRSEGHSVPCKFQDGELVEPKGANSAVQRCLAAITNQQCTKQRRGLTRNDSLLD